MTAQVDDSVYVKDMTDTGHLAHHAFDMLRYNRGAKSIFVGEKC